MPFEQADMVILTQDNKMINKSNHNPSSEYLRGLISKAKISQREAARRLNIDERTMRRYLTDNSNKSYIQCPYVVQYALEHLI